MQTLPFRDETTPLFRKLPAAHQASVCAVLGQHREFKTRIKWFAPITMEGRVSGVMSINRSELLR